MRLPFIFLQAHALVQVVVGTKSGDLLLYNVGSAELIDTIKAHSSTIWSLHVRPDFGGLVTGSADKNIKFWDIKEVKDYEEVRTKRTLPMDSLNDFIRSASGSPWFTSRL